jgi:hypothetical protein
VVLIYYLFFSNSNTSLATRLLLPWSFAQITSDRVFVNMMVSGFTLLILYNPLVPPHQPWFHLSVGSWRYSYRLEKVTAKFLPQQILYLWLRIAVVEDSEGLMWLERNNLSASDCGTPEPHRNTLEQKKLYIVAGRIIRQKLTVMTNKSWKKNWDYQVYFIH